MGRFITHEMYTANLLIKNPNVVAVEKYVSAKTSIMHRCLIHNIEWKALPTNILRGCGCSQCLKDRIRIANGKSHDAYLSELKRKNIQLVPLEQYQNATKNILHKCLICSYEWKARPANLLSGKGCPKCAKNIKMTHEQYIKALKDKNPNIIPLEQYITSSVPIKHKCNIHNYVWTVVPSFILHGGGCYYCGLDKLSKVMKKTNQQYIDELKKKNPTIINLETYQGFNINIRFKCLKCDAEWIGNPENLLRGHGCPRCRISKGEEQIEQWLVLKNINYIPQKQFIDCKDVYCLPFDFYLPTYNKCIEFDGRQHFKSIDFFGGQEQFKYLQRHDKIKTDYCKSHNIPLLRIPYYADVEKELENFLFN